MDEEEIKSKLSEHGKIATVGGRSRVAHVISNSGWNAAKDRARALCGKQPTHVWLSAEGFPLCDTCLAYSVRRGFIS